MIRQKRNRQPLFFLSPFFLPAFVFFMIFISSCSNPGNSDHLIDLGSASWSFMIDPDGLSYQEAAERDSFSPFEFSRMSALIPGTREKAYFIWYKADFYLPSRLEQTLLSLFTSSLGIADETYLNGVLIGKTGAFPPRWFSEWNSNRNYSIPGKLINENHRNTLLIKIYCNGYVGGPHTLLIGEKENIDTLYKIRSFPVIGFNAIISVLLFAFALYHLFIFYKRPKDQEDLYYALFLISFSIMLSNLYVTEIPGFRYHFISYLLFQKIIMSFQFFLALTGLLFIQTYLGLKKRVWVNALLLLLSGILMVLFWFQSTIINFTRLTELYDLSLILPLIYAVFVSIRSLAGGSKKARIMLIGFIIMTLILLVEIIIHTLRLPVYPFYGYSVPILLFVMAIVMANGFVDDRNKLEIMNTNLEQLVAERTGQLDRSHKELEETMKELWVEMELARKIQTLLLPKNPVIEGYDISCHMAAARMVGGDYYDVINVGGYDWLVIGDVSGHGVPAGLIMIMVQTAVNTILENSPNMTPRELLLAINKTIYKNIQRIDEGQYMTITVIAAFKDGHFIFSGAHMDMLVYRSKKELVEAILTPGTWLGIVDNPDDYFYDNRFSLEKNDILLLYTDGLVEAVRKNSPGKNRETMFGMERLKDILSRTGSAEPGVVKNAILDKLNADYDCNDDVALVLVKRKGEGGV